LDGLHVVANVQGAIMILREMVRSSYWKDNSCFSRSWDEEMQKLESCVLVQRIISELYRG